VSYVFKMNMIDVMQLKIKISEPMLLYVIVHLWLSDSNSGLIG
jgi:hypothetical protein